MSAIERLVKHIRSDKLGTSVLPKHRWLFCSQVHAFSKFKDVDDESIFVRKPFVCRSRAEATALAKAKGYARELLRVHTEAKRGYVVDINISNDGYTPETRGLGVFGSIEEADKAGTTAVNTRYEEYVHGTFLHDNYDDDKLTEMFLEDYDLQYLNESLSGVEGPEQVKKLDDFARRMFLPAYDELIIDYTTTEAEIRD